MLAPQFAQIFDYGLKAKGVHPAVHLLIDHMPGRQIMGHESH